MEAIYAVDLENGLSKDGIIPWKSIKDLKFFYSTTKNNIVLMGKNTYFSLPNEIKPLKNRLNIVLTKNPEQHNNSNSDKNNLLFTNDTKIYEFILNNREKYLNMYPFLSSNFKIFIIGGKNVYEQFISLCDKVWVTTIKKTYSCDLIMENNILNGFKEIKIIDEDDDLIIKLYSHIKL